MIVYLKKGIPAIENTFWEEVKELVFSHSPREKRGRPRLDLRMMFSLILYYVRDGVPVKRLCRGFCSHQTFYNYLHLWIHRGLFGRLWMEFLSNYKDESFWKEKFYLIDASVGKAIHGGEQTGKNPTDRGKKGRKRSLITDENGIPCSIICNKASIHDVKFVEENLKQLIFMPDQILRLYGDKGYVGCEKKIRSSSFVMEVENRSNMKKQNKRSSLGKKRWPVERTHAWANNFRAIRLSVSRSAKIALNFLHIACMEICWNNYQWVS